MPESENRPASTQNRENNNAKVNRIEELFAEGNLEGALNKMMELFEFINNRRDDLIQLLGQLSSVSNERNIAATISYNDAMYTENRIRRAFHQCLIETKKEIKEQLMDLPVLHDRITSQSKLLQIVLSEKLGTQFGNIDFIQHGNSGIYFRAEDLFTKQPVIIKVPKIIDTDEDLPKDEVLKNMLRLKHRNIIRIISFNFDQLPAYVIIEYINGITLTEAIRITQGFSLENALRIASHLADALEYLRKKGIRHANVRPSKIYLDDEEEPMISSLDILRRDRDELRSLNRFKEECRYLSPEALRVETPTSFGDLDEVEKSDLFSVGLILVEMLTAKPLFQKGKDDAVEVIFELRNAFFNDPDTTLRTALDNCWQDEFDHDSDQIDAEGKNELVRFLKGLLAYEAAKRQPDLTKAIQELRNFMPKSDPKCLAKASFRAARSCNYNLTATFYERFFQQIPKVVQDRFKNRERQYLMLKLVVNVLLDTENKKDALGSMIRSKSHSGFQLEYYNTFLNTLRDTVLELVPSSFDKKEEARIAWNKKIALCMKVISDNLQKPTKK